MKTLLANLRVVGLETVTWQLEIREPRCIRKDQMWIFP